MPRWFLLLAGKASQLMYRHRQPDNQAFWEYASNADQRPMFAYSAHSVSNKLIVNQYLTHKAMPEEGAEKPGQDESTAPDSETQSSAQSAQGVRNNPAINEEKTGSREDDPAEGGDIA